MHLLTQKQIEEMVAGLSQLGGCCSSPSGPVYETLQSAIRTRVEEVLNIEQLLRGVWVDRFRIAPGNQRAGLVTLRLTNAFIDNPDSVVITLSDGSTTVTPEHVDTRLGLVEAVMPVGLATVKYTSGFPIGNQDTLVLGHTPAWMQTIALAAARAWVMATATGAQPKDVSFGQLTAAIKHELSVRIYERYDRPRSSVVWTAGSGRRLAEEPEAMIEAEAKSW